MRPIVVLAAAAALALAAPALAASQHFSGKLSGAQEIPPNASKGAGQANVTLDPVKHTVSWTISYSGLSGPATMAHFHGPAPAGKSAGVEVPITGTMASPLKGEATVTDAQMKDLEAGLWYVNVHTAAHPGGEIRAQLARAR